jgi:hypothetical protein
MTKHVWLAVAALAVGCGKGAGDDGKAVVDKAEAMHQAMCACKDEACATKLQGEMDAFMDSGAIKKPTDQQMSAFMDSERGFRECAKKHVLDESGKLQLKQLEEGLKEARAAAATEYSAALFKCSPEDAARFKKEYAGVAAGAKAAFVKEYEEYCTVGLHLDAAEAAVKVAEASKDCGSPNLVLAEVKLKEVPGGLEKLAPLKQRWTAAGCN